jgi:hypothetical protein
MNFATQSLLTAVGVGAQKALAASAAINWMLKDGALSCLHALRGEEVGMAAAAAA